MPELQPTRCSWVNVDHQLLREYHDREWGVPTHDDRTHFEFLILEAAQAGLSWSIVLNKREGYRRAFSRFDPEKVARYSRSRIDKLTTDPGIVRNRMKIAAAVRNARAFLVVQEEFGSFDAYCWHLSMAGHARIAGVPCVRFPQQPPSRTHSAAISSVAGSVSSDRQ
jgi:DNA-3-methyladenine glycosylase I